MAYKSRVSNKYIGSSFAGHVNSSSKSSATDLINTLKQDINPALTQIADKYITGKKDTAKASINKLLITKTPEVIEAEILAGKHPELSGTFVDKTVSYHTGKYQAVETIAKITEAKTEKYDFQTNNLPAFYNEYLPEFQKKDGSYVLGFASVFNEYKAKESIADAEVRSKFAYNKKIDEGVKIALHGEVGSFWDIVNKGLDYKLPPTGDDKKPRKMYTNEEKNDIALAAAEYLLNTATTTDELDRGIKILSQDRGTSKEGTKLGSLLNTKRNDVSEKLRLLRTRRVTVENQSRATKDNQRQEDIRAIFALANAEIPADDDNSARPRTFSEQLDLRNKLETYGDPTALRAFDIMVDNNRFVDTDPAVFTQITASIFDGGYSNAADLMRDLVSKNVSSSQFAKALTYLTKQQADDSKGLKPIYATDSTYNSGINDIIGTIKGNFKVGIPGMEKPNSGEAVRNAKYYMKAEIINFEERFKEENNGKTPGLKDKADFMLNIGNIMKTRFNPDNVQPAMESVTVYEKEQLEIQRKATEQALAYKTSGADKVLEALNIKFEEDKGLINVPVPDLSTFGSNDADLFNTDTTDRAIFKNTTVLPFIEQYLSTALQGTPFTPEVMEALSTQDFNNLIKNIAKQFPSNPKIDPIDIQEILKKLIKQQG